MIADRWGVTAAEVARRYPCDDHLAAPTLAAWRGVTVAAGPEQVWPWVAQLRLAPYSYDWIDNLGRRSPRTLRGLPDPAPGEAFTAAAGQPVGRVLACTANEHYTGRIAGAVMSYMLVPDGGSTRLLLKIVAAVPRAVAPVLSVGDLVMARRQLLNLKSLSEAG